MKIKQFVLLVVVLALLTGCKQQETDTVHNDPSPDGLACIDFPQWEIFDGEPSRRDIDVANLDVILETDAHSVSYQDAIYHAYNEPAKTAYRSLSFGWKVSLRKWIPIGKTSRGDIVLAPNMEYPPAACVVNPETGEKKLYLRDSLHDNLSVLLDSNIFAAQVGGKQITDEALSHIVELHIEGNAHPKGYPELDGEGMYYTIRLTHKTCESLQYLIEIYVCGDHIHVLDAKCNEMLCYHLNDTIVLAG